MKDQWSSIVPAGTQIKKSTEGFNTTQAGESRNDEGNIRYLQDDDDFSKLQASIFGQYSTEAGKNWIEQGFPTLSESQTGEVDKQTSRDMKKAYTDFYTARKQATGRTEAYDAVKEAAKAGDSNKAARLAKEYNDKVNKAMTEYWRQHEELPKDLQKELLGDLYINASKVQKNMKDDK